jgi:hypothetical protein
VQVARSSLTRQRLKHEVNVMDIPALYVVLVFMGAVSTDPKSTNGDIIKAERRCSCYTSRWPNLAGLAPKAPGSSHQPEC